jgi:hypothetical protein
MTTLTLQPQNGNDSFILGYTGLTDTNYSTDNYLSIGRYTSSDNNIRRATIKFDLSYLVSVGAVVSSAVLSIFIKANWGGTGTTSVNVYRLLRNWTLGGVTWNKYDGTNSWGTPGASNATDIDNVVGFWSSVSISNTASVGSEAQFSLNITEFNKLLNGTYLNYGWLLAGNETADLQGNDFESSRSATPSLCPKLTVTYTATKSLLLAPMWFM